MKNLDWKLILMLSIFGFAMGIATVFVIPPKVEPLVWLVIFVTCAIAVAKKAPGRFFVHGLCVSLVNSVWITMFHVAFFDRYMAGHPSEAAMSATMSSPRLMMIATGPVVGLVSGLVLGIFCFAASKLVKRA